MADNNRQSHILVVDAQEDIVWSLSQALSDKKINATVATASSGQEALDNLSDKTIHLLITDIMMIEVDGRDLFIELKKKYPSSAVIVMTTLPSASYRKEASLGKKLFFIEKPFDINNLKQLVIKIFSEKSPVDLSQAGPNLADIIQLKCMAKSTSALQINKANQEGTIFFKGGEIIHATCDHEEGEEALFKILSFGKGIITTSLFLEPVDGTIAKPGETLIKEYFRRKEAAKERKKGDEEARRKAEEEERKKAEEEAKRKAEEGERKKAEEEARQKAEEEKRKKAEEEARRKAEGEARKRAEEEARRKAEEEERERAEEEARRKAEEEERKRAEEEARRKAEEEERKRAEEEAKRKAEEEAEREQRKTRIINNGLKDLISGLSGIEDYMAVGVMTPTGKLLISDAREKFLDLVTLGATFNSLYRKVRKTSKMVDFPTCRQTVFTYAENKTVIIRRSGVAEKIYFHLMAIMESNRNLDLVDRVMDDFQSRVQKKLTEL